MSIGTHLDLPAEIQAAIQSAIGVVDAHMGALNARDPDAIAATLHFSHYRLAGSVMKVWETHATYLDDLYARAGGGPEGEPVEAPDVIMRRRRRSTSTWNSLVSTLLAQNYAPTAQIRSHPESRGR